MRPLFTIHAGEYLVGSYIEKHYKQANIWIPSTDTGIDLLVSDRQNRFTVTLQVKFTKDFLPTHTAAEFQEPLRACGWFTINKKKLLESQADFWVFVLSGFKGHSYDYVVVPTNEFKRRLGLIHGFEKSKIHSYLWVTECEKCWEPRGLSKADWRRIAEGKYEEDNRDFTEFLNRPGWEALMKKLRP
jgi:hypothetical protein